MGNTPHSLANTLVYYDIPKMTADLAAVIYGDLVTLFNQVVSGRGRTIIFTVRQPRSQENIINALKSPGYIIPESSPVRISVDIRRETLRYREQQ